jgi:hypothetical protein
MLDVGRGKTDLVMRWFAHGNTGAGQVGICVTSNNIMLSTKQQQQALPFHMHRSQ